jgi:predicted nucleic acid-binding Zn ribbon protein
VTLPSLELPDPPQECLVCGEPIRVVGMCAACEEREDAERRRQSGNEYRRLAQIRMEGK